MSGTSSNSNDICSCIQELIVWYPGRTLDEDERGRVEKHAAKCPECAGLLRFVSDFKEVLIKQWAPHPSAETLVLFAENRAGMAPQQRSLVNEHLAACSECKEQIAMLEEVERANLDERATAKRGTDLRDTPGDVLSRLRGFWDSLKGGVLRPLPAAVYLTVAVLAIGLHVLRLNGQIAGIGGREAAEIGLRSGAVSNPAILTGIVLLPDETYRTRQPGQEKTAGARIDVDSEQLLLLELTGLEAPPAAEHFYTVQLSRDGSTEPAFEAAIMGREFQENYTLCLSLDAGTLRAGSYVVRVLDPDGKPVFISTITAE